MLQFKSFIFFLILAIFLPSFSAVAVHYHLPETGKIEINGAHILTANKMGAMSIEQLTSDQVSWLKQGNLSLGLPIDPIYSWFKFTVENPQEKPVTGYLQFGDKPSLRAASLYALGKDHQAIAIEPVQIFNLSRGGYSVELNLAANEVITYLLAIESENSGYLSLHLLSQQNFIEKQLKQQQTSAMLLGALLLLAIFYVLAFAFTNDRLEGLMLIHILALGTGSVVWFYQDFVWIALKPELTYLFIALAIVALTWLLLFAQTLKLKALKRYVLIAAFVATVALSFAFSLATALAILLATTLLLLAYLSLESLRTQLKGKHFFTTLNLFVTLGFTLLFLLTVSPDALPVSSRHLLISFFVVQILCSLLLAQKCLWLQRQQAQMLVAEVESIQQEREKFRLEVETVQLEAEETLESAIQERTLELNFALQELEEANRELEKKNTTDELSGLYNRRFFDQRFLAEFRRSKRELTPLSLVLIDIDHFKKINDTFGHLAGDECIRQVGHTLKMQLKRSSDVACRYGGEEFCLILPHTETDGAFAFADSLRQIIADTEITVDNSRIDVTISCGVVTYKQEDDIGLEQIFQRVDQALYQAKENGRNQVRLAELQSN